MVAAGGLVGAVFFLWISGLRVVNPTEINWVMQLDWRIHFLGWHFFRHEPWQWPPGRTLGYFHAPDGTAIGFTDSIPLAAFALKPFSPLLPDIFQYLGLWLLLCFVLQGAFAVLLARLWTSSRALQILSALLFVLMPTLLIRVGHPSLCAHWLLLWALWLYLRGAPGTTQPLWQHAAIGLAAGLIHPYLAVMVLAIIAALAARDRFAPGLLATISTVALGWWASGLFTVSGANLSSEGLGYYSMNLLSPITPSGWSTLLPDWPIAAGGQTYEGFQYFGAGNLLVMLVALAAVLHRTPIRWRGLGPVLVTTGVCAVYALSPRVTMADAVLFDWSHPALAPLAIFRATGRFFWPLAYLLLAGATAVTLSRLPRRPAIAVLCIAVAVQLVDLSKPHGERRATSRSDEFHSWRNPLASPLWHDLLPRFDHVVIYPARQCASAPIGFEGAALLAGLHRATINSAEVARLNENARSAYCRDQEERIRAGVVDRRTMYLMDDATAAEFRQRAQQPLQCQRIDVVTACAGIE